MVVVVEYYTRPVAKTPPHRDHFTPSDAKPIKFFNAVREW